MELVLTRLFLSLSLSLGCTPQYGFVKEQLPASGHLDGGMIFSHPQFRRDNRIGLGSIRAWRPTLGRPGDGRTDGLTRGLHSAPRAAEP